MAKKSKTELTTSPDKLENLLYPFIDENSKPAEKQSFEDFFYESYKKFEELRKSEPSKKDGRDKFFGYFPESHHSWLKSLDSQTLKSAYEKLTIAAFAGIEANTIKNLESLLEILPEDEVQNAVLSFPHFYSKDSPGDYKAVVNLSQKQKEIRQKAENPLVYTLLKLKDSGIKENSPSYEFWVSMSEEIAKADIAISQTLFLREVMKYKGGARKLLADSIRTTKKLKEQVEKGEFSINQELAKFRKENNGYLTAEQEEDFIKRFKENNKEEFELYEQAMGASRVYEEIIQTLCAKVYTSIDAKKKKK